MQSIKAHREHEVFEPLPQATPDEVRSLRHMMGLTQQQLAQELGVTEFSVWRWENNKRPITVAHTKLLRGLAEDRHYSKMKPSR